MNTPTRTPERQSGPPLSLPAVGVFKDKLHNRRGIIEVVRMVADAWLGDERDVAAQFAVTLRNDAGVFVP